MEQTTVDQSIASPTGRRQSLQALAAAGAALLATSGVRGASAKKHHKKKRKKKPAGSPGAAPVASVRLGNNAQGELSTSSFAQCEAGEQAISGGFDTFDATYLSNSRPVPNGVGGTPTGWEVAVNGPAHVAVQGYVICLKTDGAAGGAAERQSKRSRKHGRRGQ